MFDWLRRSPRQYPPYNSNTNAGGAYYPTGNQTNDAAAAAIHRFAKYYQTREEQNERGNKKRDRLNKWTTVGVWLYTAITAVMMILAGGSVGYARLTWLESQEQTRQARRQANTAETALATSDRPWLDAKYVDHGSVAFNPDGSAQIPLIFALENGGRSPATSVFVEVDVIPAGDSDVEFNLVDRQKVVCKHADARRSKMGAIIFPNKGTQLPIFAVASKQRIDAVTKKQNRIGSFVVTACVTYNFGGNAGHTVITLTIFNKKIAVGFDKTTAGVSTDEVEVASNIMIPAQAD